MTQQQIQTIEQKLGAAIEKMPPEKLEALQKAFNIKPNEQLLAAGFNPLTAARITVSAFLVTFISELYMFSVRNAESAGAIDSLIANTLGWVGDMPAGWAIDKGLARAFQTIGSLKALVQYAGGNTSSVQKLGGALAAGKVSKLPGIKTIVGYGAAIIAGSAAGSALFNAIAPRLKASGELIDNLVNDPQFAAQFRKDFFSNIGYAVKGLLTSSAQQSTENIALQPSVKPKAPRLG
jgi:hypothetical protein